MIKLTSAVMLLALFTAPALGAGGGYNYTFYGDDWTDGDCATGTEQSPIDFITKNAGELPDVVAQALSLNYEVFSGQDLLLQWPDNHAAKVSR